MSFFAKLGSLFGEEVKVARKPRPPQAKPKQAPPAGQLLAARAQAQEIILDAKEEAFRLKRIAEEEIENQRAKISQLQATIVSKSADLERRFTSMEDKSRDLEKRESSLREEYDQINKIKTDQLDKLERIASLTSQQAKKLLLETLERKLKDEMGREIKEAQEEARQVADGKAREILVEAMQRGATDYVPEYTVSTIKLPDEDMKGRIIGREGRNIRALEAGTGVDIELDEEGVIRISSFDPVRREIAKVSLERLMADGRIQPARIEEIIAKTKNDIDRIIHSAGEDLCHRLHVYNLPVQVVDTLGRFKYRFSYGQNMIAHTLEETKIGVALANEVGANVNIVRLGCLLHDIGKVITQEEGSHVQIGVDFLKKFNIPSQVVDTVAQHHQDADFTSVESVLVYIADAISGSRPGARYEDYEEYVQRLKKLETIAVGFEGVEQAYALQAGRELRVIAKASQTNDEAVVKLASDIRDKIKSQISIPGQVKVTVIREVRQTEIA